MSSPAKLENVLEEVIRAFPPEDETPSLEVSIDWNREQTESFDNESDVSQKQTSSGHSITFDFDSKSFTPSEKPEESKKKLTCKKMFYTSTKSEASKTLMMEDVNPESTENSLRILCNSTENSKPSKLTFLFSIFLSSTKLYIKKIN